MKKTKKKPNANEVCAVISLGDLSVSDRFVCVCVGFVLPHVQLVQPSLSAHYEDCTQK